MIGPYYVNTNSRRREAWGPPCRPNLAPVTIAGTSYKCDVSVVPAFTRLEQIRRKYGFTQQGSDTGFYVCRHMRWDPNLPYSPHSWARALDWDWLQNPAGNKLVTNMPKAMIQELQLVQTNSGAYVFVWGGDWDRNPRTGHTYYDAMHWEVVAHPLDLATGISGLLGTPATVGDDMSQTLQLANRGNAVKKLQQRLNKWDPTLDILDDGIFGNVTKQAVEKYQQAAQIKVTGVVDGLTAAYLFDTGE